MMNASKAVDYGGEASLKRALILDGCGQSDAGGVVSDLSVNVLGALGAVADVRVLHELKIAPCRACFACWVKTPGVCVNRDDGFKIACETVKSDLLILITPVVFGGYSSILKKSFERILPILTPFFKRIDGEVHHVLRYKRYPAIVAVGLAGGRDENGGKNRDSGENREDPESPESEAVFSALVAANAVNLGCVPNEAVFLYDSDDENLKAEKLRSAFGRVMAKRGLL
jgi:multimeric flavodoxin WrbA